MKAAVKNMEKFVNAQIRDASFHFICLNHLKLLSGKIIVAMLNGELLVRRFHKNFSSAFLIPENSRYKNINLAEFSNFSVWGIVTYVIHPV